jgi:hypothetical protein
MGVFPIENFTNTLPHGGGVPGVSIRHTLWIECVSVYIGFIFARYISYVGST